MLRETQTDSKKEMGAGFKHCTLREKSALQSKYLKSPLLSVTFRTAKLLLRSSLSPSSMVYSTSGYPRLRRASSSAKKDVHAASWDSVRSLSQKYPP